MALKVMRRLLRRTRRVLSGIKLLWANEDWDQAYLLELIAWKLRRMEKEILNGWNANGEKIAHRVKTCYLLAERLSKDDYISEKYDRALTERFSKVTWEDAGNDCQRMILESNPALEKKLDGFREESDLHRKQDEDLFFKLFKKHYRNFWD